MTLVSRLLCTLALAAFATASPAQEFPSKPIKMIVPYPPGGAVDNFARIIGNKLSETLKWSFIVDNRPGAAGNIGVEAAAKSPADGYTMVMGMSSNLAVAPALYSSLPYDPLKDLQPLVLVASSPSVIVALPGSPIRTLADLIARAKAKPGEITIASPGNGTIAHLTIEMLQTAAGISMTHVPYKGSNQAITDLMGGQVDLFLVSTATVNPFIQQGKFRPIAVTGARRVAQLPNVPTIAESGFKGFEANAWWGLLVPAGTPKPIVARLSEEVNRTLKMTDVRDKIMADGSDVLGGSPEEFAVFLKAEHAKWGKVVKAAGIKAN
jgi:tripartite-type tricarboxylate transporter receptor subunit TctC